MYAEVNYWSVTLYACNRDEELASLKRLLVLCRELCIVAGSQYLHDPYWISGVDAEERKKEYLSFAPSLWLAHCDEEDARSLLSLMGISADSVSFTPIESAVNHESKTPSCVSYPRLE